MKSFFAFVGFATILVAVAGFGFVAGQHAVTLDDGGAGDEAEAYVQAHALDGQVSQQIRELQQLARRGSGLDAMVARDALSVLRTPNDLTAAQQAMLAAAHARSRGGAIGRQDYAAFVRQYAAVLGDDVVAEAAARTPKTASYLGSVAPVAGLAAGVDAAAGQDADAGAAARAGARQRAAADVDANAAAAPTSTQQHLVQLQQARDHVAGARAAVARRALWSCAYAAEFSAAQRQLLQDAASLVAAAHLGPQDVDQFARHSAAAYAEASALAARQADAVRRGRGEALTSTQREEMARKRLRRFVARRLGDAEVGAAVRRLQQALDADGAVKAQLASQALAALAPDRPPTPAQVDMLAEAAALVARPRLNGRHVARFEAAHRALLTGRTEAAAEDGAGAAGAP